MSMENILSVVNRYEEGYKKVIDRRSMWLEMHKEVRAHLKEIAVYLNENAAYKPGFFVDTNHAYNEATNGTCASMPSLTFRCGSMPLDVSFKSASGDKKEYDEEGFHLLFTPTITGQVLVLLSPHYSMLFGEKPEYVNLAVIDSPAVLTPDTIDKIVAGAIGKAYYSSFTGMTDLQEQEMHESQKQYQHSPIGFKRYDSTEKVK